ncbi:MAG: ABC transporter ATP-binding protein [Candidatus Methanomethylicaceae archaeon]|nr:ABC transporter ATP-binding protein [Candidatus Verstraetearchaeota archaeon]
MIELRGITKIYNKGKFNEVVAVQDISMKIEDGSIVVLTGPSGCGKTTLLSIIGLILTPTSGEIFYDGESVLGYSDYWKTSFRRENFGFVFQHINLLPQYTALENVLLPLYAKDSDPADFMERAVELLSKLGVMERANHLVEQLSGGEQQRVAFVRALIKDPQYLFADEPTVFVDEDTSRIIYRLLQDLRDKGKTIIVSTHDPELIKIADQIHRMDRGRLLQKK